MLGFATLQGRVWFGEEHTANTEIIDGIKYTTMAIVTMAYENRRRGWQSY
jgi:hypothetical protein